MKLTIFTPTYNRAKKLPQLFQSLLTQDFKNFEWIIVDDGSTDNTELLVQEFIALHKFPIHYIKKENGGKHTAINVGLQNANGDYFFILDSDDFILPNALSLITNWIDRVEHIDDIVGVCGRCVYPDRSFIGNKWNRNFVICDSIEIREKYKLRGDLSEVYKTSILKKFPFLEFPNERFLSEALIWNRIAAEGFKIVYHNEPIKVCEYLTDGLTNHIRFLHRSSPHGTMVYFNEIARNRKFGIISRMKALINYWRYTINHAIFKRSKDEKPLLVSYLFIPLGALLYLIDSRTE